MRSGGSGYSGGGGAAYRGGFSGSSSGVSGASRGSWGGGGGWGRGGYGYGRGGGWGWGYGIGSGYWGFGSPYWYGGFPFWYDTLAYGTYYNPYYTNGYDYGGFNYGVPFQGQNQGPDGAQGAQAGAQGGGQGGQAGDDNQFFAQARAAFYAGNYQEALKFIEHAAIDVPRNQDIHQFHALCYFALGDFQQAAAVAHTVLEAGPGWDWTVVQSFYPTPEVYTQQLRGLEHYITEHGDQPATRFLLGYEYLMLGHFKAADHQFQRVVALEPRDTLAKNILAGLSNAPGVKPNALPGAVGSQPGNQGAPTGPNGPVGQPGNQGAPTGSGAPAGQPANNSAPQLTGTPPNGVAGDASQGPPTNGQPTNGQPTTPNPQGSGPSIIGSWKATPAPGVKIAATLQPDKHFTWTFSEGAQSSAFSGTYDQQGNELVLTRDKDGQKMDGLVTMSDNGGFRFRLKSSDPNDVGLEFTK